MLVRLNNSFIIRREFINKCLMASRKEFLRIKRLRCEYRVDLESFYMGEWRDLAHVRLLFEVLLRLRVRAAEFNTLSGYYNPEDPKANQKKYISGGRRFSTLFSITTKMYLMNSFFINLYWIYNFQFGHIKQEFFKEKRRLIEENTSRLLIDKDFKIVVKKKIEPSKKDIINDSSELMKSFVHSRDFKLMTLVDQNEGKEKERSSILALKEKDSNVTIVLHCFFFNFLPFSLKNRENFKRHFGVEFEFYVNNNETGDSLILYNMIVFLTAMRMNWVWVEEEIIERFEKQKTNEAISNKRSV